VNIGCVIPARFGSTRLPGKPLADIAGKPMIQRVYERVTQAKRPQVVIVATDDQRVYDAVKSFGGTVVMTDANHPTGTDRLAEVAQQYKDDKHLQMATVATPLLEDEYDDPSAVKVILNKRNDAMYFSRSLIPYPRHDFVNAPLKHIGIYAYRRQFLLDYAKMKPTAAEQTESLEQLRALENGFSIRVITTDKRFVGVDTPEDLARVNAIFEQEEK